MSFQSRQEYLEVMRERYQSTLSRQEKSQIINEAVDALGYHRKHIIREFNRSKPKKKLKQKRSKPLRYAEALPAIKVVWEALDYPCAERLHPVLASTAERLVHHGELTLNPEIQEQLQQISRSTLGRYLGRLDSPKAKRRIPRHKASSRHAALVPVATYDWDESRPGALEIDLVEHNGGDSHGHFAYTLTVVDIVTGFSRRRALLGKSQRAVFRELQYIWNDWPFKPWGLHSDNGSEFLNAHLIRFSQLHQLEFTRSRPYRKNDNAHVEQKNRQFVRDFVGHERYDTHDDVEWLNEVYDYLDLYANYILPTRKVIAKKRIGKRVKKRYDTAKTPLQRMMDAKALTKETAQQLQDIANYLNPMDMHRTIENLLAEGPIPKANSTGN